MKKILLVAALTVSLAAAAETRGIVDGVSVDSVKLEHSGRFMSIDMDLDLSSIKVGSNRAVLLTPRLVNGADSVVLPAVGIYGRRRYYHYVRNGESMLSGKDEMTYKASEAPASIAYGQTLPWQEWMNGAELELRRRDYGCCNTLLAEQTGAVGNYAEAIAETFFPELVYVEPKADGSKINTLEGSAYIDFPVNKTFIKPDYRRNTEELGKIRHTIDTVRNDPDATITQVWLKGFASPESPYEHNRELAIGRTEALKDYISQLYHFGDTVIATDYEPEDWAGLRGYVEKSNIDHKAEILDIIDSDLEPDPKEWKIKTSYPGEYRFMLQEYYPALRHTEYRIVYVIRSYSDVEEIERILATHPQKLSPNEFYLVAQKYEPGTEKFTEVYETAVRMFPADEVANLNAANAAMRRYDNDAAARYLAKAGRSPEAIYARGALAIRLDDIETARRYLAEARDLGLAQAAKTLAELNEKVNKRNNKKQ